MYAKGRESWEAVSLFRLLNKIPWIGQLINNRNLFLTVLEVGPQRSWCQYDQVLYFLGLQNHCGR